MIHFCEIVIRRGQPKDWNGIYAGSHPSFSPHEGATTRTTHTLGRDVTWHDTEANGLVSSEALIDLGGGSVLHVFYGADAAHAADLRAIAESLHETAAP